MGTKNTPLNTSRESRAYYEERWPPGGVYFVRPEDFPSLFLEQCSGLIAKTCGAVVVASGSWGSGQVDFSFNLLRVEEKERALDIHPALVRFSGDAPALSGCLLHHAKFSGRTIALSGDWAAFKANQNSGWYPVSGLPVVTSGSIADHGSPLLDAAYRCAAARLSGCMVSG
jgi:hypothetical protein